MTTIQEQTAGAAQQARVRAPDVIALAPPSPRLGSLPARLTRKLSSRLSPYLARDRRRLVKGGPIVSFTFDDFPDSAYVLGAPMLEAAGLRGVFYVASALIGRATSDYRLADREAVRDLFRRGHEIGLHGHSHSAVSAFSAQELRADIARNRNELAAIDPGIDARNFAYPFGYVSTARKRQMKALAASSRVTRGGVNGRRFDAHFLRCVELADARLTPRALESALDAARNTKGWLVFCLHDVAPSPSPYGCTPDFLQSAIDGAKRRGLETVTVAEGLARSEPVRSWF